jgi:hypothetical protein
VAQIPPGATPTARQLSRATPAESKDVATTDGTTTSTTFVNSLTTTGVIGVSFVAGETGACQVAWMGSGRNSSAGNYAVSSFELRTGATLAAGTLIQAADEFTAVAHQSSTASQQITHCGFGNVFGLTAGATYNVVMAYRVTTGTGTWNRRRISVIDIG